MPSATSATARKSQAAAGMGCLTLASIVSMPVGLSSTFSSGTPKKRAAASREASLDELG